MVTSSALRQHTSAHLLLLLAAALAFTSAYVSIRQHMPAHLLLLLAAALALLTGLYLPSLRCFTGLYLRCFTCFTYWAVPAEQLPDRAYVAAVTA